MRAAQSSQEPRIRNGDETTIERSTIRKISFRLVPFVALMFFINYLDRTAIGFASPNGMNTDLALSAAQFGFASGVFFIGYILLEVPSNLALHRFGARRWLARIMISWGVVAALFTWVQGFEHLVVLRFLLGIAEAGFFPGAILFLSFWVPARHRSKILALFYLAQPLTTVIGAPLAGVLINQHGVFFGLAGWRFMFLGVAIPAIVVGVIAWFYLQGRAARTRVGSTTTERAWFDKGTERRDDNEDRTARTPRSGTAFGSGRVWLLSVMYFGFIYGLYALAFFLPTIIKGFQESAGMKFDVLQQGLITAIPYLPAAVALWFWSRDVARRGLQDLAHRDPRRSRRREYPARPVRPVPGTDDRDHHDHRDVDLLGPAELLDPADQVPVRRRGGGRHRLDQHRRESGRLLGAVRDGRGARSDRWLPGADVHRRRLPRFVRDLDAGAEPAR